MDNKIVFLGNEGVGKSSIISRFKYNEFKTETSTIGAAFVVCTEPTTKNKLNIWDTAGQEKYDSLTPMYYRNCKIAVIVYSSIDLYTYNKATLWYKKIKEENTNCEIIMVENKIDLKEKNNDFFDKESIKVSAKTGYNINELFKKIGEEINKINKIENDKNTINTININPEKTSKCC